MGKKRLVVELGRGTDLQGRDYTKAAVRALRDALHRNSLTIAPALGYPREAMEVEIRIGVARPEAVDREAVAAVLPYGRGSVTVVRGGLDVPADEGDGMTVVANAAAVVWLDLDEVGGRAAGGRTTDDGPVVGGGVDPDVATLSGGDDASSIGEADASGGDPAAGLADASDRDGEAGDARSMRRIILETGTGADLRGEDVTKAARRAVRDALHHSSLALFGSLGIPAASMAVEIRIGVQHPDEVDLDAVASEAPHGTVTVFAEPGGLDVPYAEFGTRIVVASAAVIARLPLDGGRYALGEGKADAT